MNYKNQQSFTLIELMTVIGIIAILAGLFLVSYNIFFDEANIGSSMRFDSSIHHSLGYALVGDWKLDDNAANPTVVDSSGNGNDGTFNSGAGQDNTANHSVDGANGRALDFDGVDDYIEVSDSDDFDFINSFSVGVWCKDSCAIEDTENIQIFEIGMYNNKIAFNIEEDGGADHILESEQNTEGWNYLMGTYDGINIKLYYNSEIVENSDFDNLNLDTGVKNFRFNYLPGAGILNEKFNLVSGSYLLGSVDQTRIYKTALSSSQVKQQYYTGLQKLYKKGLISRREYIKRVVRK